MTDTRDEFTRSNEITGSDIQPQSGCTRHFSGQCTSTALRNALSGRTKTPKEMAIFGIVRRITRRSLAL